MGIRETINRHRAASTVVFALLIVGCAIWIFRGQPGGDRAIVSTAMQRFYTDDDGKSFFPDDQMKLTPFKRDGKDVVQAYVFKCGDATSVHYVARLTEVGRKAAEKSLAASGGKSMEIPMEVSDAAYEFKRPGEAAWQPQPPGPKPCPDGKQPDWVSP